MNNYYNNFVFSGIRQIAGINNYAKSLTFVYYQLRKHYHVN